MKNEVVINKNILNWLLSEFEQFQFGDKYLSLINDWINDVKKPTIKQIKAISQKIHIPFGYFFLNKPPKEEIELLKYRTVKNNDFDKPSRELVDTIFYMEDVQSWMSNYRKDNGYSKLNFVGKFNNDIFDIDIYDIADSIRNELKIEKEWFRTINNNINVYKYFVEKIQDIGIIVMSNGVVGNNTKRTLNVDEFRAFVIVDKYAPLIFINNRDANNAKIFSLLHEIVHIWIGRNDLLNDLIDIRKNQDKEEVLCNAIAAEILVPKDCFNDKWHEISCTNKDKIESLSKYFMCSQTVIARRALDFNKINIDLYKEIDDAAKQKFMLNCKRKSGGNFYNTNASRYDINFVKAVYDCVNAGNITYTDAFRLTNTNGKTFNDAVVNRVLDYGKRRKIFD